MKKTLLLVALATVLVPGAAQAATIDFAGLGNAEIVTIAGVHNVTAWAGELLWTWGGAPDADPFYSYCVDVRNNELNHQVVDVKSTSGMATDSMVATPYAAEKAAWLFNTFAGIVHASTNDALGAGLQLAIWEVLFDTDGALTTGAFRVTAASTQALGAGVWFLGQLANSGNAYTLAKATWLDTKSGYGQDQITTPEPATLLLLGTGLAGLAARRRRKTQA